MAIGDRRPSDILTGEWVPEIWSAKVIRHVRSNLCAAQVCNTDYQADLAKGDVVHIPLDKELTGADVVVTSDGVYTNMNTTGTGVAESITIDTWWEVPVSIDDSSAKQTHIGNALEIQANNAAYAFEKKVDTDIWTLSTSLTATWAGTDGQTFTDDLLIDIMEGLDEADIPADRALVTDPSGIADMRKIDKFMTFDYSTNPLRLAGYRGRIDMYDLPVFVTNNLKAATTGNYGVVINRKAIGLIMQSPMDVEKFRAPLRHSWIVNTSGFWGSDVIRQSHAAYFYTRKL